MRSTSGADINLRADIVIKSGHGPVATRIRTQAEWLRRHPSPAVPPVLTSSASHYSMPRYREIDWKRLQTPDAWEFVVDAMVSTLEQIWADPAESTFDLDAHLRFMARRCKNLPGSFPAVKAWAESLSWDEADCLTHGDPTFDNTLTGPIFIDPNPARPEVPSTRTADLANIAQSLLGYEHLKYGAPKPLIDPDYLDRHTEHPETLRYLTAAKVIRLLEYETTHRPTFQKVAADLLTRRGNP